MTVFDLDHTQRDCDSLQVRLMCGNPSHDVWASYRKVCGIASHQRRLTRYETMLLLARSRLRCKKGVTKSDAIAEANRLLRVTQVVRSLEVLTGSEGRDGKELPGVIAELTGRSISFSTLYRLGKQPKLPKFSKSRSYSAEQVRRYIRAVA
ncbi:hypothetical protein [Myxacorys almedinensis]|uniref:Uncharacterized protein n=1 Tax=Myxacorys almedinensis A TaxID=2690445 RepID=A0A8J7Z329_9CYAN|nr:hypothetical protein [Myxacorys almedinensis]NDJ19467.1 hypothetical protein [Myxacorys almedinensis A]